MIFNSVARHATQQFVLPVTPLVILISVCFAGGWGTRSLAQEKATSEDWIILFDGQTLEGWEGNLDYFRVEEQCIVAGTLEDKIPQNEFLCTTQEYGDFELVLEARLKGQGKNAGVQFRSQRIPDNHEVIGYQCDMGNAFQRSVWAALYDESRRRKMLAEGPAEDLAQWTKQDDWNELRIVAQGARIRLYLNGHLTVDYVEEDSTIERSGIIGLQIHSGRPSEAWYRNIRLRKL